MGKCKKIFRKDVGKVVCIQKGNLKLFIKITPPNVYIDNEITIVLTEFPKMCRIKNDITKLAKFYELKQRFEQIKKRFNEDNYSEDERTYFSSNIYVMEFNFQTFSITRINHTSRSKN